jgi:hypothetical protein
MHHSSLIMQTPDKDPYYYYYEHNNLLNYYSSPLERCDYKIAMNQIKSSDVVVGINCFGKLLLRSEFISYARNNFSQEIKGDKLLFYSINLNLYVYKDEENQAYYVKYLNDGHELSIG